MMSIEEFTKKLPHLREKYTEEEWQAFYRDITTLTRLVTEVVLKRSGSKPNQEVLAVDEGDEVG
jgi:hypothetical protein